MTHVLELDGVSKLLRAGETETQALQDVSLVVAEGSFVAVMGPSGCGKSTLLSMVGLLDRPSGGELRLVGQPTTGLSEGKRAALRASTIGFIFQSFNLIDELSVQRNIELPLIYGGVARPERESRCAVVMERLGVAHRARHRPPQLSGGQQQRAAIARALVTAPKIVLADEPAGNLDSAHGAEVMDLLRGCADAGTTVLMVTHSLEHAQRADRIVNMRDGRLLGAGGQ